MSDSAADTPAAIPFSLGSMPLLAAGHSRLSLVQGERLSGHGMVIAEGGEVTLHAHHHEEHLFLVLAGAVRFSFLPPGEPLLLRPLEGILLPAGCFYSYFSVGEQNLVMARVGTTRGPEASRVGLDGQPLRGNSDRAGWQPARPDPQGRRVVDLFPPPQAGGGEAFS
ncbi:MAG: hypothetical protein ACKOXO_13060 [Cyanobium sp.]